MMPEDQHALLEAHSLMLYDPCFNELAHERIEKELKNVEWVLQETVNSLVEQLEATQDSYLRERSSDILDSSRRIIDHLLCRKRVASGAAGERGRSCSPQPSGHGDASDR